ncbi:MAG: hypothetical protein JNG84_11070 [Archangium sp.]|nr:hypothetical protein [Archangium sp.]
MSAALMSGLVGAACSLGLFVAEVVVFVRVNRTNAPGATQVVLGFFTVAFIARLILLLAGSRLGGLGVHDGAAFGLGVTVAFLAGVVIQAVVWSSKKG